MTASLANAQVKLFYLPNSDTEVERLSYLGVEEVTPGSAPAQAGLVRGMEIMAIQGIRIRGLAVWEFERILATSVKSEIILTIRNSREEAERSLAVSFPRRLAPSVVEKDAHEGAE